VELTVCHCFLGAAVALLRWLVCKADSPTALPYTVPQRSFTKLEESYCKEKREHQAIPGRTALVLTEAVLRCFPGCLRLWSCFCAVWWGAGAH